MKKILTIIIPLSLLGACSPVVPPELADARRAYEQASQGPASQIAQVDLHKARESLDVAERSFVDEPRAQKTRDLAYVAERKAEQADAIGQTETARQQRLQAEREYTATTISSARQARTVAEQRAMDAEKDAQDALAKLAAVKQEDRGMVITLNGSVLFASNQSELLPDARARLDAVATALMATKERKITIEGYTDSRGSDSHNLDLSKRRAEAVRAYLVSRGYDGDLVNAEGMGKASPVADNTSAEGRANNRRVEIVVKNKGD